MEKPATEYGSSPVEGIDHEILDAFREAVMPATFMTLTASFIAEAEARMPRIQAALSHNYRSALKSEAHALKSAAALFGAMPLSEVAAYLERLALGGRDLRAVVEVLAISAAETFATLQTEIRADAPPPLRHPSTLEAAPCA